jgi:hypothetical protein
MSLNRLPHGHNQEINHIAFLFFAPCSNRPDTNNTIGGATGPMTKPLKTTVKKGIKKTTTPGQRGLLA